MTQEYSYNGFAAYRDITSRTIPLVINGTAFVGGVIDNDDIHVCFTYFWTRFDQEVEPLVNPGCWGASYRPNVNDPSKLSNHSSGTATDGNAPQHPNGIEANFNFSKAQIITVHQILNSVPELSEVLHWGGDWHKFNGLTPDPMHVEIHDHDLPKIHRVATRIRNLTEEFVVDDKTAAQIREIVAEEVAKALDAPLNAKEPGSEKFKGLSLRAVIKKIALATKAVS